MSDVISQSVRRVFKTGISQSQRFTLTSLHFTLLNHCFYFKWKNFTSPCAAATVNDLPTSALLLISL